MLALTGRRMKVDKEVMALLKATKKASAPPAKSIERFRKFKSGQPSGADTDPPSGE